MANTDFELLDFDMQDAWNVVSAYNARGKYVEAIRLLTAMKEKAQLDIDTLKPSICGIDKCICEYLKSEFIPFIDAQIGDVRRKLRSGM